MLKPISLNSSIVKKFIPSAKIYFEKEPTYTPLIDDQDDQRIRKEIDFHPRTFEEGVECLINEDFICFLTKLIKLFSCIGLSRLPIIPIPIF